MRRNARDRVLFLRSFLAHPRRMGAVLPTSGRTVRSMLALAEVSEARCVVELGAGTGVYTRELLDRMRPDARLVAFEVDPSLAKVLSERFRDPRLQVATDSAASLETYLNGDRADVIVSGLPFSSLAADQRRAILEGARRNLEPAGVLLVLQYSPFIRGELDRLFASVRWRLSPLNVPPAFLFACAAPREDARSAR